MKDKSTRKKEALERAEEYKTLSNTQKVLKLDLKLGGGVGAARQREKLAQESVKESEGRVVKVKTEEKKKAIPVFASDAEKRKWEYHQEQKGKKS